MKATAQLIIVHWNRPDECAATAAAFRAQLADMRVLILDNHSAEETLARLRAQVDASVKILRLPQNKGWGPALNVALQQWLDDNTSEYCLISAHDAQPAPRCLPLLIEAMNGDEKLGIACPEYPDGSVPRFTALHAVGQQTGQPLPLKTVREIDVPHGTLMIVRRQCLAEAGLFDERYFAYGDEHELGARARKYGWKVGLVGGALVLNPETSTASELRSYLFTRNSLLLVHDYFGHFSAWKRAALILLNTLRLTLLARKDAFAFSPAARWRGCRDYFAGRFGPPPAL
ncbi:MAG: glycosyltransferase [Verrucomicrobia bacterium]|nr:glycosyltransferase [Verrucomicrobiota bacterium]